jgi:hypothetical protein
MCTPRKPSVRHCSGNSSSDWSSVSTTSFSTQRVMTSGIQISRPVMKYFFTLPQKTKARLAPGRLRGPSGHQLVVEAGVFSALAESDFASDLVCAFDATLASPFDSLFAAAALEMEAGRAQQLLEFGLAARRADLQRRL